MMVVLVALDVGAPFGLALTARTPGQFLGGVLLFAILTSTIARFVASMLRFSCGDANAAIALLLRCSLVTPSTAPPISAMQAIPLFHASPRAIE